MRILVVAPGPSFSVADVQHGWEKALAKQGHEVRTYNLDDRMRFYGAVRIPGDDGEPKKLDAHEVVRLATEPLGNAIWRLWPDIIFVVSGFFMQDELWEVLKARPHKTVLLCTESPYEDVVQYERMMTWQPDMMLLNDPQNIERFRQDHNNVWYAPHAYDPEVHCPGPGLPELATDFSFVGTGYRSRLEFFSRVDWRGIDASFAGMWQMAGGTCLEPFVIHPLEECFDNDEAVDLYRSSKVSANLYRARDGGNEAHDPRLGEGWAVGPREIELAATRTFFLREPRPEGDELLPMLPTFESADEFTDKLRYYLKHDDEREDAARRAQEAVADRTFDAHARHLMQHLLD